MRNCLKIGEKEYDENFRKQVRISYENAFHIHLDLWSPWYKEGVENYLVNLWYCLNKVSKPEKFINGSLKLKELNKISYISESLDNKSTSCATSSIVLLLCVISWLESIYGDSGFSSKIRDISGKAANILIEHVQKGIKKAL